MNLKISTNLSWKTTRGAIVSVFIGFGNVSTLHTISSDNDSVWNSNRGSHILFMVLRKVWSSILYCVRYSDLQSTQLWIIFLPVYMCYTFIPYGYKLFRNLCILSQWYRINLHLYICMISTILKTSSRRWQRHILKSIPDVTGRKGLNR